MTRRVTPDLPRSRSRGGYTLIELVITLALLGIAGTMVIPAMTQSGVLRTQAAVRTIVADITFLQGDALAYQERRAIWFNRYAEIDAGAYTYAEGNGYVLAEVSGPVLDLETAAMADPDNPTSPLFRDFGALDRNREAWNKFGGVRIENVNFNDGDMLIFDELGGPVENLTGPEPGNGGSLEVWSDLAAFRINIAPFTGRVTVERIDIDEAD
ncbi:MAG: prepilin-type N-terminal cleavage/methylation domain-containing protein [Phycisphaerales bacterium]|nr:prepilin-type N-terminal cleavage/methylation domain-containing protein [Phycisphaerales bacterium]